MTSLGLFLPQQLASLLITFARWRLPFPADDLLKVLERLAQLSSMQSEADACRAVSKQLSWHPVFSSGTSVAPLDTNTRISCLYSLGVLLRPHAAEVTPPNGFEEMRQTLIPSSAPSLVCSGGIKGIYRKMRMAAGPVVVEATGLEKPLAHANATFQEAPQDPLRAGGAAAHAVGAAQRLFEHWIDDIFSELSPKPLQGEGRVQTTTERGRVPFDASSILPVVRLAEALANCR